jgi:hypothetical protein
MDTYESKLRIVKEGSSRCSFSGVCGGLILWISYEVSFYSGIQRFLSVASISGHVYIHNSMS